jgi:hypothetical protein
MVYLDPEQGGEPALRIACELADRFKSEVIGVSAGLPVAPIHADGMIASSVIEVDYEQLNRAIDHPSSPIRGTKRTSAISSLRYSFFETLTTRTSSWLR